MTLKKHLLLLLLFLKFLDLSSQIDTLNRVNLKQDYIGWWKIYYTEKFTVTEDTLTAKYYDYEYYISGTQMRGILQKTTGRFNIYSLDQPPKIKYLPFDSLSKDKKLDGIVYYSDKRDVLYYKEEFKNGIVVNLTTYNYIFEKDKTILTNEDLIDWTKIYQNNKNSHYFENKKFKFMKEVWKTSKGYVLFHDNGKNEKIYLR